MRFRPCIDLHGGQVKQIVGITLSDGENAELVTNFTAEQPPKFFAELYSEHGLAGGHVIALGPGNTAAAKEALQAYSGGMQVGGGISVDNAMEYIDAGASHVIVTSHVFRNGTIDMERLKALTALVGKERLVLDLSCRKRQIAAEGSQSAAQFEFVVVTDRWQKWTDFVVNASTLQQLAQYCDEFLVHGVDVEGMQCGVEEGLVRLLGQHSPIPVTYAGGVRHMEDLELVRTVGDGRVDVTVGSALDIFGGALPFAEVVQWHELQQTEGGQGGGPSLHPTVQAAAASTG